MSDSNKIYIFDTTLRDGEQCPGASLNINEKVTIAHQLEKLGVDVIEAGFPISSPAQFEACRIISNELTNPIIAGLCRANKKDIDSAADAIKSAKKKRIHTFIATSPVHMKYKLCKKPDEVLKMAVDAVAYAKTIFDDVEFSAEDACRTELPFLAEITQAVIEAGATVVNIPDTVGYVLPYEYGQYIKYLVDNVPNIGDAILSTHCHNDLGVAVANSLSGVRNGARQIECTINGIGERAGNASLEEAVMAIHTRPDAMGVRIETNINTTEIYRTSQMVSHLTGFVIQPNKAIVGANAFAHESGIHVDGMLKERSTYEIMTPETIGLSGSKMVLGRHSGRHGFSDRCIQLGYKLTEDELQKAYEKFLDIADKKKEIFDEDIAVIINEEMAEVNQVFELAYLHVACGSGPLPTASVKIKSPAGFVQAAACGDGPVDAVYEAIRLATQISPNLNGYSIRAITGGKDAMGEATVKIENENGFKAMGKGVSTDIIEASAKAYIDALNKLLAIDANGNEETVSI